jgi:hypothetical protein
VNRVAQPRLITGCEQIELVNVANSLVTRRPDRPPLAAGDAPVLIRRRGDNRRLHELPVRGAFTADGIQAADGAVPRGLDLDITDCRQPAPHAVATNDALTGHDRPPAYTDSKG